jgi:hypothetical protein
VLQAGVGAGLRQRLPEALSSQPQLSRHSTANTGAIESLRVAISPQTCRAPLLLRITSGHVDQFSYALPGVKQLTSHES